MSVKIDQQSRPLVSQAAVKPASSKAVSGATAAGNLEAMTAANEAARTHAPTSASAAGGVLDFGLGDGGVSSVSFAKTAFSLGALGIDDAQANKSTIAGLKSFLVSSRDAGAADSQTGQAFSSLNASVLGHLQALQEGAGAIGNALPAEFQHFAQALLVADQTSTGAASESVEQPHRQGAQTLGGFTQKVVNTAQQVGVDLSKMPIEDAAQMVFMLISEGAQKDTKELIDEMNAMRLKRDALRQAHTLINEQETKIKQDAQAKWEALPSPKPEFADWLPKQQIAMPTVAIDAAAGKATLSSAGSFGGAPSAPGSSEAAGKDIFGGGAGSFASLADAKDDLKNQQDSLSDLSDSQQTRMQIYMDRMSKADTANSNLMKKIADSLSSIIANTK